MALEYNVFSSPFRWSGTTIIITLAALALLAGACVFLKVYKWPTALLWFKCLLIIVFLSTVVIGVGFMPIKLTANENIVSVKRLFGALTIPRSEIVESRELLKPEIVKSVRTFGSGGLFGYLGHFSNSIIGEYTMYATDLDHLVLIRTHNRVFVFSCSNPQEFIDYLQRKHPEIRVFPI